MMSVSEIKLAIFLPSLSDGGAERVTLNLILELANRIKSIDLVVTQIEETDLIEVPNKVRVINLEASRVLTSLPALIRYLRNEKPDVMLSVMNFANIIALWAKQMAGVSTRIVVSEHNTLSLAHKNASRRRSRLVPSLIKVFYPWSDGIIAVSNGVAEDLAQMTGLNRESISVIYNPVLTPEVKKNSQKTLEHPWFKPGQPPVILAVGRLRPQKDFPTLIRAFAEVRRKYPARLLILGEGSDRLVLEKLVTDLSLTQDVSLPGYVNNPYTYLRQAKIFVLSSRWKGLPTVLIEALYCGVPVISTDCPSGPREILADGRFGVLVPVENVSALALAIEDSLTGKTPDPNEESWQPFSQEVVVEQYINILVNEHA